jgi:hypothetical protein
LEALAADSYMAKLAARRPKMNSEQDPKDPLDQALTAE